jgi:hypothetical protein
MAFAAVARGAAGLADTRTPAAKVEACSACMVDRFRSAEQVKSCRRGLPRDTLIPPGR